MADTETASEATASATETKAEVSKLPLDEFCQRLSKGVRHVELIGAFAFIERQAGRNHDTESAYRQRFGALSTRPAQ